jgi:basic amino acid/polyamine antiporter, APA family
LKKESGVFVREATGLVRDVSVFASFGVGITGVSMVAIFLFYSSFMLTAPNDNPFTTIAIMAIPFLALAAVWALLMMAFPRSGGDYVFNTRSIHPAVGFMTDFLYVAILPSVFPTFVVITLLLLSDMLSIEAFATNNTGLASLGSALVTQNNEFIITTVLVAVTLLFLIGRTKSYMRIQALAVLGAILAVVAVIIAVALEPTSSYPTLFTNFFKTDYSSITSLASSSSAFTSPTFTGISLYGTSFLIYWLAGPQWAGFVGGETKKTNRAFLYSILGGQAVMIILFLAVGIASVHTFGLNFSYAFNFLGTQGKLPTAATQGTFLDLAVPIISNPVLIAIVYILIALQAFFVASMSLVGTSRKIFAWSFDRLLPSKFSDVSPRFRTPVYSAILVAAIAEVFAAVAIYSTGIFAIISGVGVIFSGIIWGVGSLSGIFIVRKKEIFESAPPAVKRRIAGIPMIALIGLLSFVTIIGVLILGQLIPTLQGGLPVWPIAWTFGIFLGGIPYYYLVKWYRKKQGIDLSMVYNQIPPE